MQHMTHVLADPDLEKAKDGRWVVLLGADLGTSAVDEDRPYGNYIPPVVIAKWVKHPNWTTGGGWFSLSCEFQCEGYSIRGAQGFVELSDLGFFTQSE